MNWGTFSNFIAMGGSGLYIWSAYGVFALALGVDALLSARRHRLALAAGPERNDR